MYSQLPCFMVTSRGGSKLVGRESQSVVSNHMSFYLRTGGRGDGTIHVSFYLQKG